MGILPSILIRAITMSTEKPDSKNPVEPPRIKTTKLPDEEPEIPDEELEKATGGKMGQTFSALSNCRGGDC